MCSRPDRRRRPRGAGGTNLSTLSPSIDARLIEDGEVFPRSTVRPRASDVPVNATTRGSHRSLDWFSFFLADIQAGFGPFVAIYLTAHSWTQVDIGLVLTASGLVALAGQMPAGEESDNRRKALGEALSVLNERERRIFEARRLADEPITLEELADEFGVSRERVRQIEVRAFEKVQKAVKNRVAAMEAPQAPQPLPAH